MKTVGSNRHRPRRQRQRRTVSIGPRPNPASAGWLIVLTARWTDAGGTVHEVSGYAALLAAMLHLLLGLAGVAHAGHPQHESLVAAMWRGRKPARPARRRAVNG